MNVKRVDESGDRSPCLPCIQMLESIPQDPRALPQADEGELSRRLFTLRAQAGLKEEENGFKLFQHREIIQLMCRGSSGPQVLRSNGCFPFRTLFPNNNVQDRNAIESCQKLPLLSIDPIDQTSADGLLNN